MASLFSAKDYLKYVVLVLSIIAWHSYRLLSNYIS